ncbi:MAG TPA: FemAB family XrtA/PEP-CTERM system-associated protein [Candidatus Eisenbacteria bacterium]|nr:FemAB family XrtA/PEP-CTERM system-associated protein [Candidatus Eisenbacteria bacterium]
MGADAATSRSQGAPVRVDVATPQDDPAAWDAFVAHHSDATLFHRSAWQRAVAQSFRYRPRSMVARRDGRVTGVLPLFEVPTLPWGRALVSAPQAVYGGPVGEDDETRRALLDRARALGESLGARYVELRNLAPIGDLPASDRYVTFRRAILPTADENMAAIPRNQRRSIRIGMKSGLTSELGGPELLEPFYDLYSHSVRNLGTPVFPKALFVNLLRELGTDARILVVRREGRPVASVLTFFFRDEVLPYYGGARKEEFRYAVNDFMYWSLLLHGMERGCRVFDFGRSKKGSGSYDFKRHWGFEPVPLHYQYVLLRQRSVPDLSPKNPKFSIAIECWKRMPLWLSRRLGPALVRYFP